MCKKTFDLHQILSIEIFHNKVDFKKKLIIETIVFPLWFFKDIKYNLK